MIIFAKKSPQSISGISVDARSYVLFFKYLGVFSSSGRQTTHHEITQNPLRDIAMVMPGSLQGKQIIKLLKSKEKYQLLYEIHLISYYSSGVVGIIPMTLYSSSFGSTGN